MAKPLETPESPAMQILQGMGVSAGVAIGRAVIVETRAQDVFRQPIEEEQVDVEVSRLRGAVENAREDLGKTRTEVGEDLGGDLAAIFDAHLLMLSDVKFLGRVEERIRNQRVNAEWESRGEALQG